jgi:hypothetical protein
MINNNHEMMYSEEVVEQVSYNDWNSIQFVNTCPMNVGERN